MTIDLTERLSKYAGSFIDVRRIGLNYEHVTQYNLPPNPTKEKDTRSIDYPHGNTSWELDALKPNVLKQLIVDAIEPHILDKWLWDIKQRNKLKTQRELFYFFNTKYLKDYQFND